MLVFCCITLTTWPPWQTSLTRDDEDPPLGPDPRVPARVVEAVIALYGLGPNSRKYRSVPPPNSLTWNRENVMLAQSVLEAAHTERRIILLLSRQDGTLRLYPSITATK